ncbi:LysM peptidoglycan-binding domain-containing protein [Tumebacillus avium]|uniref:LysM peptidoglycan-binding domain-containing protein n=1 Tax=Tumebacillus avium TaxID=1903704 RepID=UPI0018DF36C8|nr:LysM peptidoglycan-binding domain-containing protein [Tumebacillus avium]
MQTPYGGELHLYLRSYDFMEEMGAELGAGETRNERLRGSIMQYVQQKYPGSQARAVRVFLGTMLVAAMSLPTVADTSKKSVYAATAIALFVNGKVLAGGQPFMHNDRVMVPLRTIVEGLGASVAWDAAAQRATVTQGSTRIVLTSNSATAVVNGRSVAMDEPAMIVGDSMFVPVRFVSESLQAKVAWDPFRPAVVVSNQPARLHAVASGDTLWKLSQAYKTTATAILQLNGMSDPTLYPGEQLLIPIPATTYVVQSGDTLWKLAQANGVTVDAIRAENGLTSDALTIGQVLTIPQAGVQLPPVQAPPAPTGTTPTTSTPTTTTPTGTTPTGTTPTGTAPTGTTPTGTTPTGTTPTGTTPTTPTTGEYIVVSGDTLWGLATRFNTSVTTLRSLNNLTTDALRVGQRLQVPNYTPAPPPPADSWLGQMEPSLADQLGKPGFVFPFPTQGSYDPFSDTWGDSRAYNPDGTTVRAHEGTDIMAPKGTPVVSVGGGVVTNYGWNELGGWRVTIRLDNSQYSVYYAHLDRYAPGLAKGVRVAPGQLLGYVGSTGYGPSGTEDKFVPHLHFGLYDNAAGFEARNAYFILKYWEARM